MKDRARQVLEGVPKYNAEYVASQQLLAELADTTERKLDILHRLNAERPGLLSVLTQEMQILNADKRYAAAVAAYRTFADTQWVARPMPPEVVFLALQSMVNAGDNKSAADLSVRMAESLPNSLWRHVAVLLLLSDDPARAAKMLPQPADADALGALLGLASSRQSGGSTKPWADRINQIDGELAKASPPRHFPSSYRVLVDLANGDIKEAEAELARFRGASTVGKNVAAELVSHARSGGNIGPELGNLLRATVALELGLPTVARVCALDALNKRPQCQWAAALVVESMPDPATRRRVLETLKPGDCVVAKMIQAAQAVDEKSYAKAAEIFRSISEMEKDNSEMLLKLAAAEAAAGNIEKALAIHQRTWQTAHTPAAANDAAYLMAYLWPKDQSKLADAQAMIETATKADPNQPAYLDTEGWVVHLRGDDARALRLLRQAVKGMSDSIEVHAHLGVVEAATGNRQLASWHLASAVSNAERLKAKGTELGLEQLQGLKIAQKALSDLGPLGK
jgi:tetratricopeptide (TPR) repeat protein